MLIELRGRAADLHGGDFQGAGELRENSPDAAGGDPLHVHLRDGKRQGAFTALPAFQRRRVEVHLAAHLRHGDGDFPEAGLQRLGLEPVGVALALGRALVRIGAERLGALDFHGMVQEQAHGFGQAFGALGGNEIYDFLEWIRLALWMGHVGAFCLPKPNKPMWLIPVTPSDCCTDGLSCYTELQRQLGNALSLF